MTLARPLIWGHRGASFAAPENTLAAFRLAREMGADGVELDAQRCASGEIVVIHDDSLARTTGFAGLVTETPYPVIRALDAGRGERVPLLSEVLEELPLRINVELKCDRADDRGLTAGVVKLVRAAGAADRVLLSSFNPLCLLRARLLAAETPRALLFESEQEWWLRSALAAPVLAAGALHPEHVLATPDRVRRWRRRGYLVACWTVDDPDTASGLVDSGVTGIITNRPDRMRARWP
ncbi:MAG: glycerophosphodiester phosphodiesterase [Myxococcales bacterium]|nr:glycerophosphodiester phosphodiesterase [Myxococcales bacterium]